MQLIHGPGLTGALTDRPSSLNLCLSTKRLPPRRVQSPKSAAQEADQVKPCQYLKLDNCWCWLSVEGYIADSSSNSPRYREERMWVNKVCLRDSISIFSKVEIGTMWFWTSDNLIVGTSQPLSIGGKITVSTWRGRYNPNQMHLKKPHPSPVVLKVVVFQPC